MYELADCIQVDLLLQPACWVFHTDHCIFLCEEGQRGVGDRQSSVVQQAGLITPLEILLQERHCVVMPNWKLGAHLIFFADQRLFFCSFKGIKHGEM